MVCCKCSLAATNNQMISCSGFCSKIFHYGCADVDRVAYNQTLKCPNIMWFCCDCRDLLKNQSFHKLMGNCNLSANDAQQPLIERLLDEITCLKQRVGMIFDRLPVMGSSDVTSIMPLSSSETAQPCSNSVNDFSEHVTTDDRSISDHPIISPAASCSIRTFAEVASSSVNSNAALPTVAKKHPQRLGTKPICGTKQFTENFGVKAIVPMLWLHLSKFDPDTCENDISSMAKTCLEIEECKVFKLVPKQRNVETMEYVCYKLGIKADLRIKALDPNTWPTGVYIREFNNTNFRTTLPPRVKFRTTAAVNNSTV